MNIYCFIFAIVTTFTKGTFVTECAVDIAAPVEAADTVVDRLIYELQTNPDLLFSWAFKGTGKQNDTTIVDDAPDANEDNKDAVMLNLQSIDYDEKARSSHMVFNIDVGGKPKFTGVEVNTHVTDTMIGFDRHLRLDFDYSGPLVKIIYCRLRVKPQSPSTCRLEVDTHLKFGWFFTIFISKRMYRNILEWRVERFMDNMKEQIEMKN